MELLDYIDGPYSVTGKKTIVVSTKSNHLFEFSDTGGIFSEPKKLTLSYSDYKNNSANQIIVTKETQSTPRQVLGKIYFENEPIIYCSNNPEAITLTLLEANSSDKEDKTLPEIYFPATLKKSEAAKLSPAYSTEKASALWNGNSTPINAIGKNIEDNTFPISITTDEKYLTFKILHYAPTEIPRSKASISIIGNTIAITTKFMIEGNQIDGISVDLLTQELTEKFTQHLGIEETKQAQSDGLFGQASITGFIDNKKIDDCCDIELREREIVIYKAHSNEPATHFNLLDEDLAIEGTPCNFSISNNNSNILTITPRDEHFNKKILSSKFIQSAAYKSCNEGPFIAKINNNIARINNKNRTAHICSDSCILEIPINQEECFTLDAANDCLHCGTYVFSAQLPTLEGIAALTRPSSFTNSMKETITNTLEKIIWLEGTYFTHTLFGKTAEIHLSIASQLGIDSTSEIPLSATEFEKQLFLAFMLQGAERLSRELQNLQLSFSAFTLSRDMLLLKQISLETKINTKAFEQSYQSAANTLSPIIAGLTKICMATARLHTLKKAISKDNGLSSLLPLGVSAAACLINPIMIIGAAQQGISIFNRSNAQEQAQNEAFEDAYATCAEEWNNIIFSAIPSITHKATNEIYPTRLMIAALIESSYKNSDQAQRTEIERLISDRAARLDVFKKFVPSKSAKTTRNDCFNFISTCQQTLTTNQLRHF